MNDDEPIDYLEYVKTTLDKLNGQDYKSMLNGNNYYNTTFDVESTNNRLDAMKSGAAAAAAKKKEYSCFCCDKKLYSPFITSTFHYEGNERNEYICDNCRPQLSKDYNEVIKFKIGDDELEVDRFNLLFDKDDVIELISKNVITKLVEDLQKQHTITKEELEWNKIK